MVVRNCIAARIIVQRSQHNGSTKLHSKHFGLKDNRVIYRSELMGFNKIMIGLVLIAV